MPGAMRACPTGYRAAALRREGLEPEVPRVRVDGTRVSELLRGGRSTDAVVAVLRTSTPRQNPLSRRTP